MTDKLSIVLNEIKNGYEEFKKFEKSIANLEKLLKEQAEKQLEIEEQVFNKIQDYFKIATLITKNYNEFKLNIKNYGLNPGWYKKEHRMLYFLAIMQAVHILIEGKEVVFDNKKNNYYFIKNVEKNIYVLDWSYSIKYYPDFFCFSTPENRDRAKEILSSFFGVNLLSWWYE